MSVLHRGFLYVLTAAAFAVPTLAPRQQGPALAPAQPDSTAGATAGAYTPNALEFYLANDTLSYIRPGLKLKVNSVTIGADRKAVVDYSLTDAMDQPIDRLGKTTPGAVSVSMILAWYDPVARHYTSYTTRTVTTPADSPHPNVTVQQAGTDSGGTPVDTELGRTKYTFKTVLPASFDQTKTHTLGIYATRNMTDTLDKSYYVNVLYDFRPDGGTVADKWAAMGEAATCNRCHDPLAAHGGSRQAVKLCVLCHQPQTIDPDTGNTVDMKVMIHKIHMGEDLPSVKAGTPYQIIGHSQIVADYSTVALPMDIRNCAACHEAAAAEGSIWYTRPSAAACGSCHDNVNFTTGENHAAGAVTDATCASCHKPQGDMEFDASVKGAHTVPAQSTQLKGLKAKIVSVSNLAAGKAPVVVLKITNADGSAVDGTKLNRLGPMIAGPTTSYKWLLRENTLSQATFDSTSGNTTFTFKGVIPADAKGSVVVSADMYRNVTLKRGDGQADMTQRECAMNPIAYYSLDGKPVVQRRVSVLIDNCNKCHVQLGLHGGQRLTTLECVICHTPSGLDSQTPPESYSFQRMIHRIHTGEELTQQYGIANANYNEVLYPGDRRNCLACHAAGGEGASTYGLPVPATVDNVQTPRDYFSPQGPGTAACLGCHDTRDAAAHAYLNTAPFGEACGTCHASGGDWAVEKVHAR